MEFNNLPAEIQFQIFDFFTPSQLQQFIAPACKRWHAIASEPILWTLLEFVNGEYSSQQIIHVLRQSLFIRDLKFSKFRDFNWTQQLQEFTSVQHLEFEFCELNAGNMTEFVRLFPNIRFIYFTFCNIGGDIIRQVPKFKYIETFDMHDRQRIDGNEFLQLFSTNCENPSSFHMKSASNITNRSWTKFIAAKGANLVKLSLSGLEKLTDNSYYHLNKCLHLKFLRLISSTNLNDFHLASFQIGENLFSDKFCVIFKDVIFSRLEVLHLARCNNLTNEKLLVCIQSCPVLTNLCLDYVKNLADDDFTEILSISKNLQFLNLRYVDNVTEGSLIPLAGRIPNICLITAQNCPKVYNGKNIEIKVGRDAARAYIVAIVRRI